MSVYKSFSTQEVDTHLSNFLISSWSYSKVSSFARNEKAFEMSSIYGIRGRTSATTMAGNAYHEALKVFFKEYKDGTTLDIVTLEKIAFEYLDERPANSWKLQKTTPAIEDCKIKATEVVTKLLRNFFGEIDTYLSDIKEIIDVEVYCAEWLSINGVDIPLPCHGMIDLVYQNYSDEIVVGDHKSKISFTDEQEAQLSIGEQAITYVTLYEAKSGLEVSKVAFFENKASQNKDKSAQIVPIKVNINTDTRRLYEHLLYEPLKRMCEAVSDPDYVYLINQADNFVDRAELYEFWMKTMLAEVEDFDGVPMHKRELISKRLKKIRDASIAAVNPKVLREFKENASQFIQYDMTNKDYTPQQKIEHTLRSFGILISVAHTLDGYSSNTFLIEVTAGVKIASVHTHAMDIANALNVSSVRIPKELVVYDGTAYVAIEFAKKRERNLIFNHDDRDGYKLPLGKDNYGNTVFWDLENHSTPHMLVCGATGSGKSVFITSTLEYAKSAGVDRIIIMDPKYEFSAYRGPGIEVYQEIIAIENEMAKQVVYMNELVKAGKKSKTLIIFDEFAEALLQSRKGNDLKVYDMVLSGVSAKGMPIMKRQQVDEFKSLEENLQSLAQKGRSMGFRILIATQRADTKAISGNIKVNFPAAVCFVVPKAVDSQVILDEPGAEKLQGFGDGLIKSPAHRDITRFQAYYKPE